VLQTVKHDKKDHELSQRQRCFQHDAQPITLLHHMCKSEGIRGRAGFLKLNFSAI